MPLPGRYEVRFQIKPPKSYSKKKVREILGSGHTVKPDWDNLAKALQDALCKEDSHIYRVTVTKVWHDIPGIYIMIDDVETTARQDFEESLQYPNLALEDLASK